MKLRIQFMYENGDTQMLDLILSSKSVGDFLNKAEYISEISSYDRKMLNKMKETKQEIADTQVALEDSKTNLENLQTKLSKQKSDLQILSDAKEKEMELSEEEKEKIAQAAEEYFASLTEDEIVYMGVSESDIKEYYEHYALAQKVYHSLTKAVNEEVSDDEARVCLLYTSPSPRDS